MIQGCGRVYELIATSELSGGPASRSVAGRPIRRGLGDGIAPRTDPPEPRPSHAKQATGGGPDHSAGSGDCRPGPGGSGGAGRAGPSS
jgi:hypothetical protein